MSEQSGPDDQGRSVLDVFGSYYHLPILAALIGLMLAIRLRAYDGFVREDGTVLFSSNDPWYHFRETTYVVENWPYTMPYDPWTGFPDGVLAGQFGTLWDQLVATAVLIVGLGDPSPGLAAQVMLVATPVAAALCAIPTYLLARRFVTRPFALLSILLLALIPGQFLTRSLVGSYQHHAAETLFMTTAVVAFLYAFSIAADEQPIWELVVDRDVDALRRPVAWSALAGVCLALYMYVWQPGVLLVGITGIFVALKMAGDVFRGDTPEPIAFVAAVSMAVAGLLMVVPLEDFAFRVTGYSYTQIVLPLGVALGAVVLAAMARQWERRAIDERAYPAAVVALAAASVVVLAVAAPDAWSLIWRNFLRTVGFGTGATTRTIAEAQPMLAQSRIRIFQEYGMTFFAAAAGAIVMFGMPLVRSDDTNDLFYAVGAVALVPVLYFLEPVLTLVGGFVGLSWQILALLVASAAFFGATFRVRYDVERLYLLVWTGFLICAAFTQLRFNYYLAVPVVVLSAYVVETTLTSLDLSSEADASLEDVQGWQLILAASLLLALVVPVFIVPIEVDNEQTTNAFEVGERHGPGEIQLWEGSIEWLSEGTPHPGEYGGHDNAMHHYGTYERPPDDDFEYEDGAYGVMAWWDYGHWITSKGERIPVANPFQQNARTAANFLIAPDEEAASQYAFDEEGEGVRYVMLDYSVASPRGPKYPAPTVFYNDESIGHSDLEEPIYQVGERGQLQQVAMISTQRSHESMRNRLFEYHGSAKDPEPVVVRWDTETVQLEDGTEREFRLLPQSEDREVVEEFDSMEEAREAADGDENARIGGIQGIPEERVEALEHYRLVHAGSMPAMANPQTGDSHVKIFERVEGATVEGSGAPANTEVRAAVQMEIPTTGNTFEYVQYAETDSDGSFEMTVPYSTTGYDEFGTEEGYTDVDVRAGSSYQFTTAAEVDDESLETYRWSGTADVTEGQVVGEDETAATVELEREVVDEPEGAAGGEEEANGENDAANGDEEANGEGDDEADVENDEGEADGENETQRRPVVAPSA